jgi:hypothetical protein
MWLRQCGREYNNAQELGDKENRPRLRSIAVQLVNE